MHKAYGIGKRISTYIGFLLSSKPSSWVHSPMIFKLLRHLKEGEKRNHYMMVETLRNDLKQSPKKLTFSDFGDGGTQKNRTVGDIARRSTKNKWQGFLLAKIVEEVKPIVGLEIGTSLGISLAYQQLAYPQCTFTSLEGSPEIAEEASSALSSLGLRANIRVGEFDKTLPAYLNENPEIDYVFVDGNHQEIPTISYFDTLVDHLSENGCMVFDDIYWSKGMENAWNHIVNDERVSLSVDLYHLGIVFVRKGVEKQHFKIRL